MSRPWMPFYVADYLADTGHLSVCEHGAYMLLIMHYWQHGSLPNDEARLARIARMTREQWAESRDVLADFFEDGWRHSRIERELKEAAEKYERRAAAGRKGGNAKAADKQCSSNAKANDEARLNQPQPHSPNGETIANAIAADAAEDVQILSPVDLMWTEGLQSLVAYGVSEKQARSMLGKWMRDTGNDARRILEAIARARDQGSGDPIPFIQRVLNPTVGPNARNRTNRQSIHDVARQEFERLGGELPEYLR